jgi:hypothetical protein
MHLICAIIYVCVCEHVLRDARVKRITTNKIKETYAKAAKIEQPYLENRNIRFYQQTHRNWNIRFIKLDGPIFLDIAY